MLRYACIKNASSYSTSFSVDDEAYRRIGHDSDDKCEYIFARGKGEAGASIHGGSYVKWSGGSGKILRGAGRDEREIIVGWT